MVPTLSGYAIDASEVAEIVMLVAMAAFTGLFLFAGSWWKEKIGVGVCVERVGFIVLLLILVVQTYVPFSLEAHNILLWVIAGLLGIVSIGVLIGTWGMLQYQKQLRRLRKARDRDKVSTKSLSERGEEKGPG